MKVKSESEVAQSCPTLICTTFSLSINEHLGCLYDLAVVNTSAMNMGCMYLLELQFCLDIYPGVGLLDHMTTLFFVF